MLLSKMSLINSDNMATYPTLIAEVCGTEKTTINVSKAIPVMIRWAQHGITNMHYENLNRELGYSRFSGIGHVLGCIDLVLTQLSEMPEFKGEEIPTLNALCTNKSTGLPSYGFDFVRSDYNSYDDEAKKLIVAGYNTNAISYKHWQRVLTALCLEPSVEYSEKDEELIRTGLQHGYGESEAHKELKSYIAKNPQSLNINDVIIAENEFILLSGDRLDVYFKLNDNTRIAVEVKSKISSDDDILRGIYQCVKYNEILKAENYVHGDPSKTRAILVIEGKLSESNNYVKKVLGVEVIENFKARV